MYDDDDQVGSAGAAAFPGETEWLDLQPPAFASDFVDRTLAALAEAGLVAAAPPDADAPLPQELLANHAPPPVRRGFVEATLARVQRDRAEHWRQLLLRYESPAPTRDFVARTLQALAAAPARRRPLPWRRRTVRLWTGFAAAAALVLLWFASPPRATLDGFVAAAPPRAAWAHSPAVLSHLLARQLPLDAPALVAGDAAWLWSAEAGR